MAVDQLMTFAGTSEVFDLTTNTQLDYQLTPSQEAYVEFQQSTDAGVTWTTTSTDVLTAVESASIPAQAPNTQYRVRCYGGVGTLRVQLDGTP